MKNCKSPVNTEMKHISGHWYLYERFTRYDSVAKKSRKVSESALGR